MFQGKKQKTDYTMNQCYMLMYHDFVLINVNSKLFAILFSFNWITATFTYGRVWLRERI